MLKCTMNFNDNVKLKKERGKSFNIKHHLSYEKKSFMKDIRK